MPSPLSRRSKIETLEGLILMSASGIDADSLPTDSVDAEGFNSSPIDETTNSNIEPTNVDGSGNTTTSLLPVALETYESGAAQSGVAQSGVAQSGAAQSGVAQDHAGEQSEISNGTDETDDREEGDFNIQQFESEQTDDQSSDAPSDFSDLVTSADADLNLAAASTTANEATDAETAATAPYSQHIVLNGDDNEAILEDNGDTTDNLVQLRSVNGTFETIVFELPTDRITIDLGAGDDSLVVDGLNLGTLSANITIYGKAGDDSITLNAFTTSQDVSVYDMDGNNTLDARNVDIGGSLYVTDGDGTQTATLTGLVQGNFIVGSKGGGSSIRMGFAQSQAARIGGSVIVNNQGTGEDVVNLGGTVEGDFFIDAGDGDFELRSIFSSVRGSLFTNVNKGSSTIFLGDFDARQHSSFNTSEGDTDTWLTASFFTDGLTINNGLGFDRLRLDGSSIRSAAASGAPGTLTVHNGDGGSSTALNENQRIFRLQIGELRLFNGVGEDTLEINLRERDTLGTLHVDNGNGDTTAEIAGIGSVDAVTLISGEGEDEIFIRDIDIRNKLIIDTGNGGGIVDIQNSNVGYSDIRGTATFETVYGDGDDQIFAPVGYNIIDGGAGYDSLIVYEGTSADFQVTRSTDGRVIVMGPGLDGSTVRNELTNVERIVFNDRIVYLSGEPDPQTIHGTDGDDWIAVSDRGGNVEAGDGDDTIYALVSQTVNEINGGAGTDTLVIYEGVRADYIVRRSSDESYVELEGPGLNGSTVTNRLFNVEYVLFNDGRVAVEHL